MATISYGYRVEVINVALPSVQAAYVGNGFQPLSEEIRDDARRLISIPGIGFLSVEYREDHDAGVHLLLINGSEWAYAADHSVVTVEIRTHGTFVTSASPVNGRRASGTVYTMAPPPAAPGRPLTQLVFSVRTSMAPSWFDGPGTDADVSIRVGRAIGPNTGWVPLNNWGNDFEAGDLGTYTLPTAGLTMDDLEMFELRLQRRTLGLFNDAWNIAAMTLTANGEAVYRKANTDIWLDSVESGRNTWRANIRGPGNDLDLRYNENCFLCAHNAYAAEQSGWWYAQQSWSIRFQLERGVRALMLDVWPYPLPATAHSEARLCHELADTNMFERFLMRPSQRYARLHEELAVIKKYLDDVPTEVVTLLFESRVDRNLMQAAFDSVPGLQNSVFRADRDRRGDTWPTLREMIRMNKRLVVFTDNPQDGLPYLWDYAVENHYGDDSLDRNTWTTKRLQSWPLTDTGRQLFVLNHFPTWSIRAAGGWLGPQDPMGVPSLFHSRLNDAEAIKEHIDACRASSGRWPNFIAVDFFELGANGGPAAACRYVNANRPRT